MFQLFDLCFADLKNAPTWELWVKFYLEQNEDYSLGDSLSDRSEKLLQRGMGKIIIYVI